MKKFLVTLSLVGLCSCSTSTPPDTQGNRDIAANPNKHTHHAQVLRSIQPIQGLEKKERDEDDVADKLVDIFRQIEDNARNKDGSLNRGTHAKGKCFAGEVEVFSKEEIYKKLLQERTPPADPSAIAEKLAQGVFANSRIYNSEIRFANGKGNHNPDTVGDVRGLSFSIQFGNLANDYAGDGRMDFMMNTSPMFAVNNIHEFHDLMKASRLREKDFKPANFLFLKSFKAVDHARKLLKEYERTDAKSYATEEYWANLPYTHGIDNDPAKQTIVKYKATPCKNAKAHEPSAGKAPDYLQTDILERAAQGNVCFELQAQIMDLDALRKSRKDNMAKWDRIKWIENGGAFWDENILPFHTLGEIRIPKSVGRSSVEISCDKTFLNTRLHSNRANQPVGSIARVRTWVEEISRARRMGELP